MKKLRRIAGYLLAITAYAASVWGIYALCRSRAVANTTGKKLRLDCDGEFSLENCRFTELPMEIHWFSDVHLPTGLYALTVGALIIYIVKMARMSADPADNDAKE